MWELAMQEVQLNLAISAQNTKKQSLITGSVNVHKQLLMTEIVFYC